MLRRRSTTAIARDPARRARPSADGASVGAAALHGRRVPDPADDSDRARAADRRGRSHVSARACRERHAHRAHRADRACGSRRWFAPTCRKLTTIISSAGGGGFMGGSASSVNVTVKLKPRTERTRTNDQIATDLRRVLVGIPGTTITTRASGGNQQLTRALGGGNQDSRLAVEIRGEDLDRVAPHRAGRARTAQGRRPASRIRRSAAKKAGRSWRFASIGRRRRCSA